MIACPFFILVESDWKITELSRNLKDEKQEKKQLSNRLVVMEEELTDAKMEKDTIDKVSQNLTSHFINCGSNSSQGGLWT